MTPHGPAGGYDTAPESLSVAFLKLVHRSAYIEKMNQACRYLSNPRKALLAPCTPIILTGPC
ncbi:hypothetical protein, partial [Xanthomonas hortorum]|uniref:hypothetical protein n=1 Tax=Xanthomonas hortorum TaxID=56454 RepID=UPI0019D368B1